MKKRLLPYLLSLIMVICLITPQNVQASSKIKKNVSISYEKYEDGIVAIIKNKNKFNIYIEAEMYYYKNNKLLDTTEEACSCIGAGKTTIIEFSSPYNSKTYERLKYDKYKMKYAVEKTNGTDRTKDIKHTEEKMENGEIHCELEYKGKKELSYLAYCVLFYNNGELVDFDYSNELFMEKGDTSTSNLTTRNEYTDYKFYIMCAYSRN